MSAISDFAAQVATYNTRTDTAVATLTTEFAAMNTALTALQNSPGAITPSDQALLNAISTHAALVAGQLEVLDGLTPPVSPVAPTPPSTPSSTPPSTTVSTTTTTPTPPSVSSSH